MGSREPMGLLFWGSLAFLGVAIGGVLWMLREAGLWQ